MQVTVAEVPDSVHVESKVPVLSVASPTLPEAEIGVPGELSLTMIVQGDGLPSVAKPHERLVMVVRLPTVMTADEVGLGL